MYFFYFINRRSYVEAGIEGFELHHIPTAETYKEMLQRSPIVHVDKVQQIMNHKN